MMPLPNRQQYPKNPKLAKRNDIPFEEQMFLILVIIVVITIMNRIHYAGLKFLENRRAKKIAKRATDADDATNATELTFDMRRRSKRSIGTNETTVSRPKQQPVESHGFSEPDPDQQYGTFATCYSPYGPAL